MQDNDDRTAQPVRPLRDGYTAPALRILGSVDEMTQGVGGSHFDAGHGTFTKVGV